MTVPSFARSLAGSRLLAAIGAHDALGARLAEEAGFDAVWASGFELSAAHAVPDASIVTMTQQLEAVRAMAAAVTVPIIADLDTGYGNAVNAIHAVTAFEAAGAAAVVIEDKRFPKDTSLLPGGRQVLEETPVFAGKIRAACDARRAPDLVVIARTEALIAGRGRDEALARAEAYVAAGADAVLVHAKDPDPGEVFAVARAWQGTAPLVLVPTAYPQVTEAEIAALGTVRLVIYGNHGLRAAVAAMARVFRRIRADGSAAGVEAEIASLRRIFELQGVAAMKAAEREYGG